MTKGTKRVVVAVVMALVLSAGVAIALAQSSGGTTGEVTYNDLSLGQHTFEVRACDAAGNCDPTPAIATWEVFKQNTAPQATATWHADTASVSVDTGGDIKEVLFYVNGVMAARKTSLPYERRTKKTGDLVFKQSVRENDGDSAVTILKVTN